MRCHPDRQPQTIEESRLPWVPECAGTALMGSDLNRREARISAETGVWHEPANFRHDRLSKYRMGVSSKNTSYPAKPIGLSVASVHPTPGARPILTDFYIYCKKAKFPSNGESMSPLVTLGRIPLQSKLKPRTPLRKLRLFMQ